MLGTESGQRRESSLRAGKAAHLALVDFHNPFIDHSCQDGGRDAGPFEQFGSRHLDIFSFLHEMRQVDKGEQQGLLLFSPPYGIEGGAQGIVVALTECEAHAGLGLGLVGGAHTL